MDVSGNATFAGTPIVYGHIDFVPDEKKGNKGPPGMADISNGKFDTKLGAGRGIVKGPQRVLITAYPEVPKQSKSEAEVIANPVLPLFVNYEMEVDFQSGKQDLQVPDSAKGAGTGPAPKPSRPANFP